MKTLTVEIDGRLQDAFSELRVLCFVADDLKGSFRSYNARELVGDVKAEWSTRGITPEQIGQLPLVAPWRAAFTRQGVKPSQFRSSAEALIRRFASAKYSETGIALADGYNALSARHQVPMGAYDVAKLGGQRVTLRFGRQRDNFEPLGGKADDYVIDEKIAVYAVGSQVICWCFNHRDSRATCIGPETDAAFVVLEAIDRRQYEAQDRAAAELRRVLSDAGAGLSELRVAQPSVASL
jgi:DNA/RNA-binding domain of Phe-tRNA-synthetase-like protein